MDSYTYFSDPVHGFIAVNSTLMRLVETPEIQRLRRIRQVGTGHLVFPVGEHSRFTHALGSMALMGNVLRILKDKGTPISTEERNAAMAAMLLHDLGHSPISHALENVLVRKTNHERISLAFMHRLAERFGAPVDMAAQMFDDKYERPFFNQLIAGQLDMDRLDYLRRDSHMSGVVEGRIGVERILQTMRVHPIEGGPDSKIVIEAKGIHAVENVLTARRHMYWQVYLHKAVLAADAVLISAMKRARHLIKKGLSKHVEGVSPALAFFLKHEREKDSILQDEVLDWFLRLDDSDVIYSLKQWCNSTDWILADLSRRFIERELFRCFFIEEKPDPEEEARWEQCVARHLKKVGCADPDATTYYMKTRSSKHSAYELKQGSIHILYRDDSVMELSETPDTHAIAKLRNDEKKPYVCYPKGVELDL